MLHQVTPKCPLPVATLITPTLIKSASISTPIILLPPTHNEQLPMVVQKIKQYPHTILKQCSKVYHKEKNVANSIILKLLHIYNKRTGKKEIPKSLLNNQLICPTWTKASSNKYGCPMNGNDNGITGTHTMEPIVLDKIPNNCAITYGIIVCNHRLLKKEPDRYRLLVGG